MKLSISSKQNIEKSARIIYLVNDLSDLKNTLSAEEYTFAEKQNDKNSKTITVNSLGNSIFIVFTPDEENEFISNEKLRIEGFNIYQKLISENDIEVSVKSSLAPTSLVEGLALSSYEFNKYKSDKEVKSLSIDVISEKFNSEDAQELENLVKSNFIARDFVNEPQSYLNTIQYSEDLSKFCNDFGIKYTKLEKEKIEELGMGGLLAVNKGSSFPPIFNIMEYKPANATNTKPIVFIGKGVVYDTGGLSLKPTPNSMDIMKCDMGGSAAVAGAIFAIAQNKLPVHVISIIAATDNWIGKDAYAPGDVITMYNGKTVEVLNTDAEGRLTLGDALTYADELNPELVIDLATLTGAAARAIGKEASVMMGNAPAEVSVTLQESGMKSYERLVEFPLFEEYKDDLKSDIADVKNLGGAEAGAITAGIFLQYFTKSPWIHIDIAGTAFLMGQDKYRGKNGTGVGVRLLYQFAKDYYNVK